jgi:hypothetical protein
MLDSHVCLDEWRLYFRSLINVKNILVVTEKAVSLANTIGGEALRLADLETFTREEGMILANATSLGMYPNVDGTPVPKVPLHPPLSLPPSLPPSLINTNTIGVHYFFYLKMIIEI